MKENYHILNLIAAGDTKSAIELLLKNIDKFQEDQEDIYNLSSRYQLYLKEKRHDTVERQALLIENNKINMSIIDIVNKQNSNKEVPKLSIWGTDVSMTNTYFIGFILLIILIVVIFCRSYTANIDGIKGDNNDNNKINIENTQK